jgi:cysteine desulfurase/selenocysteine lyase
MIRKVTFEDFTSNDVPWKFEAGTPNIADVIAFGVAIVYIQNIGLENIYKYETELTKYVLDKLKQFDFLKIYNPMCHCEEQGHEAISQKRDRSGKIASPSARNDNSNGVGIITFSNPVVHPHDIATIVDQEGVAIRAGHHCAQPLMKKLGVSATARASFYFYNTKEEIDVFINALQKAFDYFEVGACKELKQEAGRSGKPMCLPKK